MSHRGREWIALGRIRGVFGVKGWLRVESFTEPSENILNYARWRVSSPSGHRFFRPHDGRWHGPGLVVQLATEDGGLIADREAAVALVNCDIEIQRRELPEPPEGEVYWADLVGLRVIGIDDELLGEVVQVTDNPAHPILTVEGEQTLLIPFVRGAIIESVNLEAGEIRAHWSADYAV